MLPWVPLLACMLLLLLLLLLPASQAACHGLLCCLCPHAKFAANRRLLPEGYLDLYTTENRFRYQIVTNRNSEANNMGS